MFIFGSISNKRPLDEGHPTAMERILTCKGAQRRNEKVLDK